MATNAQVSFSDSATAFKHKSTAELKKARLLFKSFDYPVLLKWGPGLARMAVSAGLKGIIKNTIFAQFCGGETIQESEKAMAHLAESHVGTILDYSVEGEETETVFEHTCNEIIATINRASGDSRIPFSVFKTTGIIRFALLEKVSAGETLQETEQQEWQRSKERFERICRTAFEKQVRLFVDAEESWIQNAIDDLTGDMMEKYNTRHAIVFNTIQLYRHDRLEFMKRHIASTTCFLGYKLVRGAYMEKERERAREKGYPDPIQPDKESCDRDYDKAVEECVHHRDRVTVCAGTHNEESCRKLTALIEEKQLQRSDERIWFSQLLGMSDHISFNLAAAGYNVAKYVPYGPVSAVIPYLTRRAIENSGVAGQMSRERGMIETELKRRKQTS